MQTALLAPRNQALVDETLNSLAFTLMFSSP